MYIFSKNSMNVNVCDFWLNKTCEDIIKVINQADNL